MITWFHISLRIIIDKEGIPDIHKKVIIIIEEYYRAIIK